MDSKYLRSVDLNLLKVFAAVYTLRNLTRAGEHLAMTQPAVSRALQRLRHTFKDRLFYRSEGEMRPTRTADAIAPAIFEGLTLLEAAVKLASAGFDPARTALDLRFGGNDYVVSVVVPPLMRLVRERAPGMFLSAVPATYQEDSLFYERTGIDCAVVSSAPTDPRLAGIPLFREDYVAVCAADNSAVGDCLSLETYLRAEHVLVSYSASQKGWVDEHLARLGLARKVVTAVHVFSAVPHLILGSPYLSTLPRRVAARFKESFAVRVLELPFDSEEHFFHMVWPRYHGHNPISIWFRSLVVEACGQAGIAPPDAFQLPAAAPRRDGGSSN